MYQKPDFVKVSLKVNDIFSGYSTTGCPADEQETWTYTIPCEGTDDYRQVHTTFVGLGLTYQCYSTLNP